MATSQFTSTALGVSFRSVTAQNGDAIVVVQCDASVNGAPYSIEFTPTDTSYTVVVKDVITYQRFHHISAVRFNPKIDIFL